MSNIIHVCAVSRWQTTHASRTASWGGAPSWARGRGWRTTPWSAKTSPSVKRRERHFPRECYITSACANAYQIAPRVDMNGCACSRIRKQCDRFSRAPIETLTVRRQLVLCIAQIMLNGAIVLPHKEIKESIMDPGTIIM